MRQTDTGHIIIGKVGAPYGIKGWFKVTAFTTPATNILAYNPWYLAEGETWQPMEVSDCRAHGKGFIAKLAGLHNPEQARLLTGKNIAIMRSQLPKLKKNEYYWTDLEGLTVINYTGEVLGKISFLMETGSNDVLVVKGEKEYAIPYLPGEVVTEIDLAKQVMHVHWDLL